MLFPHLSLPLLLYYPIPYYSSEHPSSWFIRIVIPASISTPCCCSIHQREHSQPAVTLHMPRRPLVCACQVCVLHVKTSEVSGQTVQPGSAMLLQRCPGSAHRSQLWPSICASYSNLWDTKPMGCLSKLGVATDISVLISNSCLKLSALCNFNTLYLYCQPLHGTLFLLRYYKSFT